MDKPPATFPSLFFILQDITNRKQERLKLQTHNTSNCRTHLGKQTVSETTANPKKPSYAITFTPRKTDMLDRWMLKILTS